MATIYLAAAHFTTPFVYVWPYDTVTRTVGTKVTNPGTLPTQLLTAIGWHPDGTYLICGVGDNSEGLQAYNFDTSTGTFGAKLAAPATDPPAFTNDVEVHPNGNYIAVATGASPYLGVWNFDKVTGAFGSKLSQPAANPASAATKVKWSNDGLFIAASYGNSPRVSVWPFDPSDGTFGTRIDPATIPTAGANSVAWSAADDFLIVGFGAVSPFIHVYPFDGSALGTPIVPTGTGPPTAAVFDALFNGANEDLIIVGQQVGDPEPLSAYEWNGSVFGDRITAPSVMTPDNTMGLAVSLDGTIVATASTGNSSSPHESIGTYDLTGSAWDGNDLPPLNLPAGRLARGVALWEPIPPPAPEITDLSPDSGTSDGGTPVTLTGTNFTDATGITFDGTPGTNLVVVNDTTATIVSPAHDPGAVRVAITTPTGTSSDTPADDYTYIKASISFEDDMRQLLVDQLTNEPTIFVQGLPALPDDAIGIVVTGGPPPVLAMGPAVVERMFTFSVYVRGPRGSGQEVEDLMQTIHEVLRALGTTVINTTTYDQIVAMGFPRGFEADNSGRPAQVGSYTAWRAGP
ncbi:hypothetical protein LCGC14_0592290 [marine sediment metagenome]|uniref:IPT/TIG domain-containing protein n=1 Tax=marine sediment metagenome TaxID=412755 RepID=A0A0F9TZ70_9ZZZZ